MTAHACPACNGRGHRRMLVAQIHIGAECRPVLAARTCATCQGSGRYRPTRHAHPRTTA